MWTRAQLKTKAKGSIKANYWKAVLVALILALITGSGTSIASSLSGSSAGIGNVFGSSAAVYDGSTIIVNGEEIGYGDYYDDVYEEYSDLPTSGTFSVGEDGIVIIGEDGSSIYIGQEGIIVEGEEGDQVSINNQGIGITPANDTDATADNGTTSEEAVTGEEATIVPDLDEYDGVIYDEDGDVIGFHAGEDYVYFGDGSSNDLITIEETLDEIPTGVWIAIGLSILLIVLVIVAIGILVDAFLLNPVEVGVRRFFLVNLNRKAEVKEVATAFDHNYLSGVKTMFLRDLFIFLWSLLFIIPGIIKSYSYRMIPYLIAENPEMDYKTAFEESKRLMHGNKWRTFVLDLSFIGWFLLSMITLGIVGLFYVDPYYAATNAALYEELRYGNGQPEFANQPVNPSPAYGQPQPQAPYGQPVYGQPQPQAPYGQPAANQPSYGIPYAEPAQAADVTKPLADEAPAGPQE